MAFSWWWPFSPKRNVTLNDLCVVVYTRAGCHLCDEALALLAREQQRFQFALQTIDIDSQPDLLAQYNECVPVVMVDGKVRFRGRVSAPLLRRLFEAAARERVRAATGRERPN